MGMNIKKTNKYFRTADLPLASFLFARGIQLTNIDKITNQKRAYFVFVDSSLCEELVYEFSFAREDDEMVAIDARKLIHAIKALKEKLYQDN